MYIGMQALWKLHTVVCHARKCPYVVSLSVVWQTCGHFGQLWKGNALTLLLVLDVIVDDVDISSSMQMITRNYYRLE